MENELNSSSNNVRTKISRIENNSTLLNQYREKLANLDTKNKKDLMSSLAWLFITDNIKKNTREKIQKELKLNDLITLVLALVGIVTNIVSSSIYITFQTVEGKVLLKIR
jgi:hypothetical protein